MKKITLFVLIFCYSGSAWAELPFFLVDTSGLYGDHLISGGGAVPYDWGTDWVLDGSGNPIARGKLTKPYVTYKTGSITGTTYYYQKDGVYVQSDSSNPPIESGVSGGLLCQDAAVNWQTGSTNFNLANWTQTRLTGVTDNPAYDDATQFFNGDNAYGLIGSTLNNNHYIIDALPWSSGTTGEMLTMAVWAKSGVSNWIQLIVRAEDEANQATVLHSSYFDLNNNGAVGTTSGISNAYVQSIGNGWVKCWMVFSVAGVQVDTYVYLAKSDGDVTANLGTTRVHTYIGNVQLEEGSIAHSPIPTLALPVGTAGISDTTAPRWAMSSGLTNVFSGISEQGTMVVKLTPGFDMYYTAAFFGMVSPDDAAVNGLYVSSAGRFAAYDGTSTAYEAETGVSQGVIANVAVKWGHMVSGASKFQVGVDTGTGITWGTAVDWDGDFAHDTYLNFFYGGYGVWNIGSVRFYDEIRTDAQINGLY